jgi:phospholipid transport system substrate-binding protein
MVKSNSNPVGMIRFWCPGLVFVGLLALSAGQALAGAPTDQLRESIGKLIRILEDPALNPAARAKDRRAAIRTVTNEIFDFTEAAKRSLAHDWQNRTDQEREEFIALFGDLLERSCVLMIELYGERISYGDRITYTGESLNNDLATVRTKIVIKPGTAIPVDYRMLRRQDRWLIHDVSVEGVSLIANYRAQFSKIMQASSYQELVKKMRARQGEFALE